MPLENETSFQEEGGEETHQEEKIKHQILEKIDVDLIDYLENRSMEDLIIFEKNYDLLPTDLKDFWRRKWLKENAGFKKIISDLEKINSYREKENFEKIIGYHVSNKDLKEGSYLMPDSDGEVYYTEDIQKLFYRVLRKICRKRKS